MTNARPGKAHWIDTALVWGGCALFIAVNIWAAVVGRELQTALTLRLDLEVLAENRAACERLRAPPGSDRFLVCVIELERVRQNARERSDAQDLDLL